VDGGTPRLDALLLPMGGDHRVRVVATLVILYPLAWAATAGSGGSQSALPHAFYIPVLLAAFAFGPKAGLVAGIVAAVLCGPLMPFDTATGEQQGLANWLTRGAFFAAIGGVVGTVAAMSPRASGDAVPSRCEHPATVDVAVARTERPSVEVEAELRAMLRDRRFRVVFQPIYSFDTGALQAVEALARFDTPYPEPPDVWFARADHLGLGEQLELAVIEDALDACAVGLADGVTLSVNCSPSTLRSAALPTLLGRWPDRPIVLEITEHAVIEDYPGLVAAVRALRRLGVRLAVDDAGAGFSSFRHIVRLEPDIIKLDISLTQNVRQDPVRRALAGAIVDFVHNTDGELIAEGIEQPSDLHIWSELGASAAQGFLLARPGPLPPPGPGVPIPRRTPIILAPDDLAPRVFHG
jgi:EAL domain-containing protein (putative c-di-GMP-specific phosphodiesterase class I)